jgi:hypothetical protein
MTQSKKFGLLGRLGFHLEEPSPDRDRDTGLAFVLLFLIIIYLRRDPSLLPVPMLILVVSMALPIVFRPLAVVWFGLAGILGAISSRIVLSLLFLGLVTPIGLIRRMAGVDSLQRKEWRNGTASVFKTRDHRMSAEDLEKPY